jgi:dCMP deaminase
MTNWDVRFLALARYVAQWSKDTSTRVGAVVVAADDRRKLAIAYNGFPPGVADTPERLADRPIKYALMNHAEENALDNATFDVRGGTLYCTIHPCVRCTRAILSRRVARVVTGPLPPVEPGRWTEEIPLAQQLLREAGVEVVICE